MDLYVTAFEVHVLLINELLLKTLRLPFLFLIYFIIND